MVDFQWMRLSPVDQHAMTLAESRRCDVKTVKVMEKIMCYFGITKIFRGLVPQS